MIGKISRSSLLKFLANFVAWYIICSCIQTVLAEFEPQPESDVDFQDIKSDDVVSGTVDDSKDGTKPKVGDVGFIHGFVASFSVIIVSELGDKTFFIAAIMAMKHPRLTVFTGAIGALIVMTVLSALFGQLANLIPRVYTYYISTALFAFFGLKMLKEGYYMKDSDAQEELEEVQSDIKKREDQLYEDTVYERKVYRIHIPDTPSYIGDLLDKSAATPCEPDLPGPLCDVNGKPLTLPTDVCGCGSPLAHHMPTTTLTTPSGKSSSSSTKRLKHSTTTTTSNESSNSPTNTSCRPSSSPSINTSKTNNNNANNNKIKSDDIEMQNIDETQKPMLEQESRAAAALGTDPETAGKTVKVKPSATRVMVRIFMQAFTMTFLAEWGDRSQLATIILAARDNVYGVIVGGCIGHAICTGLAVIGGRMIAQKISVRTVTIIGGVVFLLFAVSSLFFDPNEEAPPNV